MRGQAILIHFLRLKYFKNYLKYEKFENIKKNIFISFYFQKNGKKYQFLFEKYFFKFFLNFRLHASKLLFFATKMTEKHFTKVAKSGKIKNVACWFTVCVGGSVGAEVIIAVAWHPSIFGMWFCDELSSPVITVTWQSMWHAYHVVLPMQSIMCRLE